MRVAYKDELDKESKKFYCSPFRRKMVEDIDENGDIKNTWITEKFEPNPDKIYRIFFIDKCRSGQNSGDSGEAMLLEFDANHSVFKEVAYCKPKRLLIQ